jgi:protein-tyrosine phosphatase
MPFEQWTDEVYKDTKDLIQRRGLQAILAHVERYTGFQKDREIWDRVMDLPVTIQMNAGSFLKFGMTRHFCRTLLRQEAGRVIIGSDCHNLTSRPPNLAQAMAFIRQKEGEEIARKIEETENRLFWQPM